MTLRVLLIDDDARLFELLRDYLADHEISLAHAPDGPRGLAMLDGEPFDAVLLDVMMPGMGGLTVLERLRHRHDTPVLMLTARGDEADRVVGLEMGADDYVAKPFSPKELVARVRAVLRRTRAPEVSRVLAAGRLVLDEARHMVTVAEGEVTLTPKEFDLLRALLEASGRVLGREFLLEHVWGYRHAGEIESRTVDVHIRRLRAKLGSEGRRITTIKGVGYRLEAE